MKTIIFLPILCISLILSSLGCLENKAALNNAYEIPSRNHDLSYTPFDATKDNPNYVICDSTNIGSGRNRLQYIGGKNKLKHDMMSKFLYRKEYEKFTGYIVIRFLVNCEGKSGRYRGELLNLDFSPSSSSSNILNYAIELVKSLDTWKKASGADSKKEYSKYINLKISNGEIQHVLL